MRKSNSYDHGFHLVMAVIFSGLMFMGCEKDPPTDDGNGNQQDQVNDFLDTVRYSPSPYIFNLPDHFPSMPVPGFNMQSKEGVKLGRMLYYDDVLSTTGKSCNTCHNTELSFTNPKIGPTGNAIMPHINLGFKNYYGWEGGEDILDHVAVLDLESPLFLQPDLDIMRDNIAGHENYLTLFKKSYGIDMRKVSNEDFKLYISYALAQFMRTQISSNSRFDQFMNGEVKFTPAELKGMNIFFSEEGDCFHCHGGALLTDLGFHNNGLDSTFNHGNEGRFNITGNNEDRGAFNTPTLRNIELTAPYMHDNRFQTLREVVDFYSGGLKYSEYIDPLMKFAHQGGVQLTEEEKDHLVAFLKTFTDTSFINDPELQNPFH